MKAEGGERAIGRTLVARVVNRKKLNNPYSHFRAECSEFGQIGKFPHADALFASQGADRDHRADYAVAGFKCYFLINHLFRLLKLHFDGIIL